MPAGGGGRTNESGKSASRSGAIFNPYPRNVRASIDFSRAIHSIISHKSFLKRALLLSPDDRKKRRNALLELTVRLRARFNHLMIVTTRLNCAAHVLPRYCRRATVMRNPFCVTLAEKFHPSGWRVTLIIFRTRLSSCLISAIFPIESYYPMTDRRRRCGSDGNAADETTFFSFFPSTV